MDDHQTTVNESSSECGPSSQANEESETDGSLLEESLRLSPWERMLANDDALNFAQSLRDAMKKRHAKS